MPTATGYSVGAGGKAGYFNEAGWNTAIKSQSSTMDETPGIVRREGGNTYVYAYMCTGSAGWAGYPVKLCTGSADASGNISPIALTPLLETAAGYFSCYAATVQTMDTGSYDWFLVAGMATLPVNSNTGGYTFGLPLAPSSSSAGLWAQCAAPSGMARVLTPNGATVGTSTASNELGYYCCVFIDKKFA